MAKRRKTTQKRGSGSRGRRRIGAMGLNPDSPMVPIAAAAAGFLLGDKINALFDKVTGTMDGKLVGAIEGGAGAALIMLRLGKKKSLVQVAAGGLLAGAGVKRLLQEFGVINGIGGYHSVPALGNRMRGYHSVPALGMTPGYTPNRGPGQVNGGYVVNPAPKRSAVMGGVAGAASGSGLMSSAA
jgi:hypothetical protein